MFKIECGAARDFSSFAIGVGFVGGLTYENGHKHLERVIRLYADVLWLHFYVRILVLKRKTIDD